MSKENYTIALDNLLKRYGKDRVWLSILCRTPYRDLQTLLKSRRTTYSQLQALLLRGGVTLTVSVQGQTPQEGGRRMQFMKNFLQIAAMCDEAVAGKTGITAAPGRWYEADDIALSELCRTEQCLHMTLRYTFTGLSDEGEDTTKNVITKKEVNWGPVGAQCRLRFQKACRELYGDSIPTELRTHPVLVDAPRECLRRTGSAAPAPAPAVPETETETEAATETVPPATAPAAPEGTQAPPAPPEPEPQDTEQDDTRKKEQDRNNLIINEIKKKTGFGWYLSAALAFGDLNHDVLVSPDKEKIEAARKEVDEVIAYFRESYSWVLRLIAKKGLRDEYLFILTKTNWCKLLTQLRKKETIDRETYIFSLSLIREAFGKGGYGFVLRLDSCSRLDRQYRNFLTGAIRRWMDTTPSGREIISRAGIDIDDVMVQDDILGNDETIQKIADATGERLFFHLYRSGTNKSRPEKELVYIEPTAGARAGTGADAETPVPEKDGGGKPLPAADSNEDKIAIAVRRTGFRRDLAGGLILNDLDRAALPPADLKAFTEQDALIEDTLGFIRTHYSWLMEIMRKKGLEERDLFTITRTDWCAMRRRLENSADTWWLSRIRNIFKDARYGLTLRRAYEPKLPPAYKNLVTGAIKKWADDNPDKQMSALMKAELANNVYNHDDWPANDEALQMLADLIGEPLTVCLFHFMTRSRPADEMVIFYPKGASAPAAEPSAPRDAAMTGPGKAETDVKGPAGKESERTAASSLRDLAREALGEALGECGAAEDYAAGVLRGFDTRYGEDALNAVAPFDTKDGLLLAKASLRYMEACRRRGGSSAPKAEPDFETKMLVSSNRAFINRMECAVKTADILRESDDHKGGRDKTLAFDAPVPARTDGSNAVSLTLLTDGTLSVTLATEEKGLFRTRTKLGTVSSDDPARLADLFTNEGWHAIVRLAGKENRRRLDEAVRQQQETSSLLEKAASMTRSDCVRLVECASHQGLLAGFAHIIGDVLYDDPKTQAGTVLFRRTADHADTTETDIRDLPVETLAELNRKIAEHLLKQA